MLRMNNSIPSINAQRMIHRNVGSLNRQLERLSSGLRVNRADDDASGLVVSEGMRGEIAGLGQNVRNAQAGVDLLQVAEGSLQEVNNILVRMRELAIQSGNSTINDSNREALSAEFSQLAAEIDRIAQGTTYNDSTLLTGFGNQVGTASTAVTTSAATGVAGVNISAALAGTYSFVDSGADGSLTLGNGAVTQTLNMSPLLDDASVATGSTMVANFDRLGIQVSLAGAGVSNSSGSYVDGDLNGTTLVVQEATGGVFQIGPTDSFVNRLEVGIADLRASGPTLNLDSLSIASLNTSRQALSGLDEAVTKVSAERGKLGAAQNRLGFSISYNENEIESMTASDASIRDADIALEATEFSRSQILLESSNAMLAQANLGAVQALSLI
jgi:flagellin